MELISRQLVLKKLALSFPDPNEAEQALSCLDRIGKLPQLPTWDLVHLAIIKLSEGKLWRLRELVKKARKDPRDVLYPAEAPEACRQLRERPPAHWGEIRLKSEKLNPAKESAMAKRDQKQWIDWLSS